MESTTRKDVLAAKIHNQFEMEISCCFLQVLSKSGDCSVGYQVGHDTMPARNGGSIHFCTPGIVLQWIKSDCLLKDVSHVVLDEVRP
jgi:HrpA-like RNA helicase